jgi:molybdopterin adenylyltransferase
MAGIDIDLDFLALQIALVCVSSTRDLEHDRSGDTLEALLKKSGHRCHSRSAVIDQKKALRMKLEELISDSRCDCIITMGGTGLTGSDITPEVLQELYDKHIPGFGELFRAISYEKIGTSALQSRATGGLCRDTFIFALPGSPSACQDGWEHILKWQLDIRWQPCNLVQLLPRLLEDEAGVAL